MGAPIAAVLALFALCQTPQEKRKRTEANVAELIAAGKYDEALVLQTWYGGMDRELKRQIEEARKLIERYRQR